MSIWGKIIGGAAGLLLGGPLGALIGVAVGHMAHDRNRQGDDKPRLFDGDALGAMKERARQVAFTVAVVTLAAKMAKADGVVTRAEIDAFKRIFRIPPEEVATVGKVFDAARQSSDGFEVYARQIAGLFRDSPAVLEELLTALYLIARADGDLHPAEETFLARVAEIFGLDAAAVARARSAGTGYGGAGGGGDGGRSRAMGGGPDPYAVLGAARSASDDELKAAYRKLLRENHPDALAAQGLPEEFISVAEEKMKTINAAWDQIQRDRGLK
ncbi:TerB family tellurite resistance protein [Caenispirillum bisanense]|uniref:TerB family tellurite resistance protein n=1 Tax=Caenispirillum bisanense TaxID=414052 RepID=UPI0031CDDC21